MEFRDKFKKIKGERIPDIIEYLKKFLDENPNLTISVGCDSSVKRRKIAYAVTIMIYDNFMKNGAHIVFFRTYINEKLDTFNRLYKEGEIIFNLAEFINSELTKDGYKRNDITDDQIRLYKLHKEQHKGINTYIDFVEEERILRSTIITPKDKIEYKICDVHLDYNMNDGMGKNKSHNVFKTVVPWLKSSGYRVFCKPYSHASTSAADLLVK